MFSVDSIILDASITKPEIRDLLDFCIATIANGNEINVRSWEGRGAGSFRKQFLFQVDDNRSFWLGAELIGAKTWPDRFRLDFNPNKLGADPTLNLLREFIVRNSRSALCRISRFDLAIDIPIDRNNCFLVKDRRLYIERRHGAEYTQYLGSKSSTVGRVKLYNKQLEAGLDYPLTRLELTLDPQKSTSEVSFPTVYLLDSPSSAKSNMKASDTDRFVLNALLQGYGTLNDLGRKTRKKMEALLSNFTHKVELPTKIYDKILCQVGSYLNAESTP